MKLTNRLTTASLAAGSLACTALALSAPATAAESVNIPAISSASFAEVERGGIAYFSSSKRTDYPDGFAASSRPSGVRAVTTRMVLAKGATSYNYESRGGIYPAENPDFNALPVLNGQGVKSGSVSVSNPTPGPWITANRALDSGRANARAQQVLAGLAPNTAITGIPNSSSLASAARSIGNIPPLEIARAFIKVPQAHEPVGATAVVSRGNFGSPGFVRGVVQYQWQKANFTNARGDNCRTGDFYVQANEKGLITSYYATMVCKPKGSKTKAEYRAVDEIRVVSYNVKDADVPGASNPSVAYSSLSW